MRICPSCCHENLEGADACEACETSLTLRDTNPEYSLNADSKVLTTLGEIEHRDAAVLSPSDSLGKAIDQMKDLDVGCVLVVKDKNLVGILTERDVLKKVVQPNTDIYSLDIENFMTTMPEVLTEEDSLAYALNKMAVGKFRHVPIAKADGGFAFFSVRDALRHLF